MGGFVSDQLHHPLAVPGDPGPSSAIQIIVGGDRAHFRFLSRRLGVSRSVDELNDELTGL